MATNNPFAEACKMLYEVEQESIQDATANNTQQPTVSMAIVQDRKSDKRRYNAPRMNEVAVIFQNSDSEPPPERDLLIHCRVNAGDSNPCRMERISVLDPNLEPSFWSIFCFSLMGIKVGGLTYPFTDPRLC